MTNDMDYPFIHPSFLAFMLFLFCFFLTAYYFASYFVFFSAFSTDRGLHKTWRLCLTTRRLISSTSADWLAWCVPTSKNLTHGRHSAGPSRPARPQERREQREREAISLPSSLGKNQPIHTGPTLAPRRTTTPTESYDLIDQGSS